MSFLTELFGEPVTFVARTVTGQDSDGNDVYGSTSVQISGCIFAPEGSSELVQGQDTVLTNPTVYLPAGAPLPAAVDQVTVRGITYNVDGQPAVYQGNLGGPVVRLSSVT